MDNPPGRSPSTSTQDNLWPMLAHLSALAGLIIPFGNILGPLVVWLVKKDEMPIVNEYGKESLNFQISATLYLIALGFVAFILTFIGIGLLLYPVIGLAYLADLILVIIASVEANKGNAYHYPLTIAFIK